jgi:TonB family protein
VFRTLLLLAGSALVAATPPKPINLNTWFSSADYPEEAAWKGTEGTVRFEVDVDASGTPTQCRIIRSSGSSILDEATCKIVKAKGRFQPATGADGQPVSGAFTSSTAWRNPTKGRYAYKATILDFDDAGRPNCSVKFNLHAGLSISCEQLLAQTDLVKDLGVRYRRVVFLTATSDGAETPYRGEASWGRRLSFLASEQFYLKGSYPVACSSVAAEGLDAGRDACAGMPGRRELTAAERRVARKVRLEASVYGVAR